MTNYAPIVLDDSIDVYTLPKRSYDFNKGDRRFFDAREAREFGRLEAIGTGVRQVVRRDATVLGQPTWVVQAVGS